MVSQVSPEMQGQRDLQRLKHMSEGLGRGPGPSGGPTFFSTASLFLDSTSAPQTPNTNKFIQWSQFHSHQPPKLTLNSRGWPHPHLKPEPQLHSINTDSS